MVDFGHITIMAVTVKPADVDPMPVVKTERGMILEAKCKSCDFPVPGSPTRSKCGCDLGVIVSSLFFNWLPPANTTANANFTINKP